MKVDMLSADLAFSNSMSCCANNVCCLVCCRPLDHFVVPNQPH